MALIHEFPIISKGGTSNEPPPPDESETLLLDFWRQLLSKIPSCAIFSSFYAVAEESEKIIHPAVVWAILIAFPEFYAKPDKGSTPNKSYFQSLSEIVSNHHLFQF